MKKIVFIVIYLSYVATGFAIEQDDLEIHGYITQGYLQSDNNDFIAKTSDGTFQFNEIGLNFSKKITAGLDASIQFFAYDFGDLGNDEITVNHAFVSAYYSNWLTFSAGKAKVSYGLYGDGRDMDMLRPFVFLPQGVYPEGLRENIDSAKGISLYGSGYPERLNFMSAIGDFYYHVQYGVMDIPKDSGLSKVVAMIMHSKADESSSREAINMILGWESPVPGLRIQGQYMKFDLRLSGTTFNDPFWEEDIKKIGVDYLLKGYPQEIKDQVYAKTTLGNMPILYSADITMFLWGLEYTWNDLMIAAESVLLTEAFKADINVLYEGETLTYYNIPYDNNTLGYYTMAAYRFTDWLRLGGYYSVYYPNKENKNGRARTNYPKQDNAPPDYFSWHKDSCVAAQFDLSNTSIFKLEAHYMDGGAQLDYMSPLEDYSKTHRYWYLFAAKLSFNF